LIFFVDYRNGQHNWIEEDPESTMDQMKNED